MPSEISRTDDDSQGVSEISTGSDNPDSANRLPQEIIENLNERELENVTRLLSATMEMSVTPRHTLVDKMTENHISDMISLTGKGLEYSHSDRQRNRIFWGLIVGFVLALATAFAVFLTLQDMDSLLAELIKGGVIFLSGVVGGLGGGYGLARRNR